MPRIDVPSNQDPMMFTWTEIATDLTGPAAALSSAVYEKSSLPLREFEMARVRIAQINDCQICLNWRSARDVASRADEGGAIDEEFYAHIGDLSWSGFSEREVLAGEFAGLFAQDHLAMDNAVWDRMHAAFSDDEIVDLSVCVGSWLASGRLNRVLDVDGACRVPVPGAAPVGG